MPTLENRRLYLKLCTLYEIIYGYFYFQPNVFIPQPSRVLYNHPSYINLLPTPIICICVYGAISR